MDVTGRTRVRPSVKASVKVRVRFRTNIRKFHILHVTVSCKMRDAGQVWKSKVQGIRCGAKVRGNV